MARAGVDLGGTKIQVVVVDENHAVTGQARVPTPHAGGPEAVADAIASAVRTAAEGAATAVADLAGVGVGSPGTIDPEAGTIAHARNVQESWSAPYPMAATLQAALGPRIALGNDVRVATQAEARLGAGRPYRSFLGVFWGTGVGGCLVIDGRPFVGRGAAGEIGHTVVHLDGALCTCGRRGCVEAYAGRAAMEIRARRKIERGADSHLLQIMRRHDRPRMTSGVWERALAHDDELATHLVRRAVHALSAGIASAVNLLDVEAIVLGGGMGVRLAGDWLPEIEREMAPHLFVPERPPALLPAALGDLGGAVGASLLVA
ncbi:MAG TPA: ROK family protein [Gaiellales bacterium]|nr:ROK family protein [Gaiellales bacterium]